KGREVGLVSDERYARFLEKKQMVEEELERLANTTVGPKDADEFLIKYGSTPLKQRSSLMDLMKRPQISYEALLEIDPNRPLDPSTGKPLVSGHIAEQVEVQIKYSGYIEKQLQQVERFKKLENRKLSPDIDYENLDGLRIEAKQKLSKIKPLSVGQASRISGVSPADINVLLIHLERTKRSNADE
ncbi:MAG: tRNA uridine-5-carboxymethylaminomethyl(34) synthesis enzyme MnmG, partial [Firmicutes bacterium]|nr:tRNA uridine-5-carboxymethylaminomethyl(34) synthesis enzyme MnmG [Bacillota bacterium]